MKFTHIKRTSLAIVERSGLGDEGFMLMDFSSLDWFGVPNNAIVIEDMEQIDALFTALLEQRALLEARRKETK